MSQSFHLIKPYLVKHRFRIFIGLSCLMIVDFMQLYIPRLVKRAVDGLTVFGMDNQELFRIALIITGLSIGIAGMRYVWRRCLIGLALIVEEGLRNRLFGHLHTLSATYYNHTPTGDLMARATNDIKQVRMATGMGLVAITDAVVLGLAAIIFMAYIDVRLRLYLLIPMPGIILTTRIFGKKMHRRYQEVQAGFSTMTESAREFFSGIRMIKINNRQPQTAEKFEKVSENYIHLNLRLARITRMFIPLMIFFSNLSLAVVIFLGGRQTITATISPGEFVAFISYLGLLTWPMMAMGWLINLVQRGRASLERIDAIIQTPSDIVAKPPVMEPITFDGGVELVNVTFHYPAGKGEGGETEKEVPVLNGIDLSVLPGESIGIVGPPGAGKTTILNLIPRLYDVTTGAIRLDGNDIRHLKPDRLREQIAIVPQEPFLFSGTLHENIAFGKEASVDDKSALDQLSLALEAAALDHTIQSFDDGLDTLVGEKGVILSGGQKQRVALARALYREVPILLLDDPISQVDIETADTIIQTLKRLNGRCTIIMVSHRLSALRYTDRIVVLENGIVTATGTHEELVAGGGYYARTAAIQAWGEELNGH